MTKKKLPKFFLFGLVILFIAAFFAVKFLPDLIEKKSLTSPPPFKRLTQQESKPATQSGKIKYPHDYTFVILGDSMTETLGNSDELKGYLNQSYPDKTFEVLNYGYGSTSIKSAKERLTQTTHHGGRDFAPILDIDFDYLLVESFGHNPLSEYKDQGLKKQTEILDDLVELVATTSGKEKLIFVGTIGTNKQTYAKTTEPQLDPKVRQQWAEERDSYIKNHLAYAKSHNIPHIDIFTPSLDPFGNAKQYLIRNDDSIHPSPSGVLFISKRIADFLAKNNYLK
jgi:lysophospholipase L1-like esterase